MNYEKLVSNHDLIKFVKSQNLEHNCIFFENNIESIESLFPGKNNFAILFIENEGIDIGHWVLILNDSYGERKIIEYFDCLAKNPPKALLNHCQKEDYEIFFLNTPLMAKDGILCGKYCIARIMSRDTHIQDFYDILTNNKLFKADEVINLMYRLEYE